MISGENRGRAEHSCSGCRQPASPGARGRGSAGGPSSFQELAASASPSEPQAQEWRFPFLSSFSDCSRSPGFFFFFFWCGEKWWRRQGASSPSSLPLSAPGGRSDLTALLRPEPPRSPRAAPTWLSTTWVSRAGLGVQVGRGRWRGGW